MPFLISRRFMAPSDDTLSFCRLGVMDYGQCFELQQRLHQLVSKSSLANTVLLVEHPNVITFGKNVDHKNLLISEERLQERGVSLFDTDRGGDITAHMPGQLVVYPILHLSSLGLLPKTYVELLCSTVILVLKDFSLAASVDLKTPGVWVGASKICAVGVRIRNRTSLHGIALNICNDLSLFNEMHPCGLKDRSVTSMSQLLNQCISLDSVCDSFIRHFANALKKEPLMRGFYELPSI